MFKKFLFVIIVSLFFFSCNNIKKKNQRIFFEEKGFVGNLSEIKIQNKDFDILVGKQFKGNSIKITNLHNKKFMNLYKIKKFFFKDSRIAYISNNVARELEINKNFTLIKIESIKKNRTFVANKAKIFQEERRLKSTSKVNSVKVISLNKKKPFKTSIKKKKILLIQFGSFYNFNYAIELKNNLKKFLPTKNIAIKGKAGNYFVNIGPVKNLEEYDLLFKKLKLNKFNGYEIIIK